MDKETLAIVENITRELFNRIGLEGDIRVSQKDEESVLVEATCEDPQLFIGERGQTLFEIAHILKALIRKKTRTVLVRLALDINDYQKNKEQYLRELARTTADEVVLFKADKELPAMTPVDRRIVHLELAERQDVVSESVGEGPERRVVIRLRNSVFTPPSSNGLSYGVS